MSDIFDTETSLTAKLDQSGITAKAKSRAIAALDRLVGSAIDIPGAWIEGISKRARLRNATKEAAIEADGKAALRHLENSGALGERTVVTLIRELERKQINRESVALEAVEELKLLPALSAEEIADDQRDFVEDDWLNFFSTHAENASSDRLRQLWGRILAGEIRKPGTFSLTTIRTISEMDKEIAALFQAVAVNRFEGGLLPKPDDLRGRELLDLTFLEEVGLLQDVNGLLGWDLKPDESGFYVFKNGDKLLRIRPKPNSRLGLIRITRVGREIASILPPDPAELALIRAAEILKSKVDSAELCQIHEVFPDGRVRHSTLRNL